MAPAAPAAPAAPPLAAWAASARERIRIADISLDGAMLCAATQGATLESWDLSTDTRRFSVPVPQDTVAVAATARACILRTAAGLALAASDDGPPRQLADSVVALSPSTLDAVFLARAREVWEVTPDRRVLRTWPVDVGVTAVGVVGPWLALGFREGGIELIPRSGDLSAARAGFERTPASAVERIISGPMDSTVVGYASGEVGIWDTESGVRLMQFGLHGPAVHLLVDGTRLVAASELGDHAVADLREYQLQRCDLLREVWASVPVVWENGRVAKRPPPDDHPCSPGREGR